MNQKAKEGKKKSIILVVMMLSIFLVACDSSNSSTTNDNSDTSGTNATEEVDDVSNEEESVEEPVEETTAPAEVELTAGHYVAGTDFPSGTYNLTVKSGQGNVSSSNMYSGGLNATMGTPADDLYTETFNNANFEDGVVLSIGGNLLLNMTTDAGNSTNVKTREQSGDAVELSDGNYTAGTDFPAGTYNIVAVNGGGNVSSDNMFDGGLNEIMGTLYDDMYNAEFKNATFEDGNVLTISGVTVQLVPVN